VEVKVTALLQPLFKMSSEAPGINRQGCEVDQLAPSRAEDANESNALYLLHLYAFLVWKGTAVFPFVSSG
jgi:hypothetical protein